MDAPPDIAAARRLIVRQFPHLENETVSAVQSDGTDNAIFRIGERFAARLPRNARAAMTVAGEQSCLERLSALPLACPKLVGRGEPDGEFLWPWSLVQWIEGEPAMADRISDFDAAARSLSEFLNAVGALDATGIPPAGASNGYRGAPLQLRREPFVRSLPEISDICDTLRLARIYEASCAAPEWPGPARLIHGDLHGANLLVREGQMVGVIDFGLAASGDPACDLLPAWWLLPATARPVLRDHVELDDASWQRGMGWALSVAVIALACYRHTNLHFSAACRRAIHAIAADPDAPA